MSIPPDRRARPRAQATGIRASGHGGTPRVAVVMAGQLRSLPTLAEAHRSWLRELRSSFEVDLFVHSWTDGEPATVEQTAIAGLGPVAVALEVAPEIPPSTIFPASTLKPQEAPGVRSQNFSLMWASIQRGYEMACSHEQESGVAYDVYVRTRPDVVWAVVDEVHATLGSGVSHFPRRIASTREPFDLAWVATRGDASQIFTFWSGLAEFRDAYVRHGYRSFVPEFALGRFLESRGVQWRPFDGDVALVRAADHVLWFWQDPWHFAFQATRSVVAPEGDGLPTAMDVDARLLEDLASNLDLSGEDLESAAALARTVHTSSAPPGQRLGACLDRSRWRPRLRADQVFVAGVALHVLRSSRNRRGVAFALGRRPVRAAGLLLTLLSVAGHRWRRGRALKGRYAF